MTSRTEDEIVDMISEALRLYDDYHNVSDDPDESISTSIYTKECLAGWSKDSCLVLKIGKDKYQITVVKR
jgi:hypothetical protein